MFIISPPINAPTPYLEQMFGPGVRKATETYKNIKDDLMLKGLLALFGSLEKILHSFKVDEKNATGYNEKGDQVISVPVTEPTFIREFFDDKLQAYRHNTP